MSLWLASLYNIKWAIFWWPCLILILLESWVYDQSELWHVAGICTLMI